MHAAAEAADYYSQAIACTQQAPVENGWLVHLYGRRGRTLELSGRFDDALANYLEMMEVAAARGEPAIWLASLAAQCIVRATQTPLYDPPLAKELGEQALALARELSDRATESKVL